MKKGKENRIKFLATTVELSSGRRVVFYTDRIKIYSTDTSTFMELSLRELGEIVALVSRPEGSK